MACKLYRLGNGEKSFPCSVIWDLVHLLWCKPIFWIILKETHNCLYKKNSLIECIACVNSGRLNIIYIYSWWFCFLSAFYYAYVLNVELCVTTFPQNESLLQVLAMNGYQPTSIKLNTTAPRHQYSNMNRNR